MLWIRKIIKLPFVIISIVNGIVYLLSCISPFVSPVSFPTISLFSLLFPYTLFAQFLLICFWIITKPKYALYAALVTVIGYQQIRNFFSISTTQEFSLIKTNQTLRVAHWNVRSFNGFSKNKTSETETIKKIFNKLNEVNADVICLQEFNISYQQPQNSLQVFRANYPYYYFSSDYKNIKNKYVSGCVIFSKYPITDSFKLQYPVSESIIGTKIIFKNKPIFIYTSHLQSFKFNKDNYADIEALESREKVITHASTLVGKVKMANTLRATQAQMAAQFLPYNQPLVFTTDLNDVPTSYCYKQFSKHINDAFIEKSFGIGKSYHALALPTLRIDYIFHSKQLNCQQFYMEDEGLSDHSLLVADFKL